ECVSLGESFSPPYIGEGVSLVHKLKDSPRLTHSPRRTIFQSVARRAAPAFSTRRLSFSTRNTRSRASAIFWPSRTFWLCSDLSPSCRPASTASAYASDTLISLSPWVFHHAATNARQHSPSVSALA